MVFVDEEDWERRDGRVGDGGCVGRWGEKKYRSNEVGEYVKYG